MFILFSTISNFLNVILVSRFAWLPFLRCFVLKGLGDERKTCEMLADCIGRTVMMLGHVLRCDKISVLIIRALTINHHRASLWSFSHRVSPAEFIKGLVISSSEINDSSRLWNIKKINVSIVSAQAKQTKVLNKWEHQKRLFKQATAVERATYILVQIEVHKRNKNQCETGLKAQTNVFFK